MGGDMKKSQNLVCLFCKYFYFDGGSPGYSEYTPGCNASMCCNKGHWDMWNLLDYHRIDLKTNMKKAQHCDDYEASKDEDF